MLFRIMVNKNKLVKEELQLLSYKMSTLASFLQTADSSQKAYSSLENLYYAYDACKIALMQYAAYEKII